MKNLFKILRFPAALLLVSPLILAWLPLDPSFMHQLAGYRDAAYTESLMASFRELSITMSMSLLVTMGLCLLLAWLSVLSLSLGRFIKSLFSMIESIPSILVALFFYAPVSGYLARQSNETSALVSLGVFVAAATITILPEAIRGLAIPLSDLYYRKYSISFRSYGFTKARILGILMASRSIRSVIGQVASTVLIKTLVLDCSFGFIIQLGFGSYGTPAHLSPGALIAARRDALFEGGIPQYFWLPSIFLIMITGAFILILSHSKKEAGQ